MFLNTAISILLTSLLSVQAVAPVTNITAPERISPIGLVTTQLRLINTKKTLSSHTISLDYRYPEPSVSEVFKDNILLNLAYMRGYVASGSSVDWDYVKAPFSYKFTLKPGESFAYHDIVNAEYAGKVVKTTNSRFNYDQGFKSDGYLVGDGVCHLASLISWSAKDAGLQVLAPSNHDFAPIPEVPKEQGVAIYYTTASLSKSARENLYITNNTQKDVDFIFKYDGVNLTSSVITK